jgi:tetratricopeptide (TPR) repeat protein
MTIKELIEQTKELIDLGEDEQAEALANELIKSKQVEGFDFLTTILAERNEIEKAIKILEQGIEVFPTSWKLWMRLGNYQSDLKDYQQAEYSLNRSEFLSNADIELIRLNKAVLFKRTQNHESALRELEKTADKYPIESLSVELGIYDDCDKYERIIERFDEFDFNPHDSYEESDLSEVYYHFAHAQHCTNRRNEAIKALNTSLSLNRSNNDALWLRRELFGQVEKQNKYFYVMIHGEWNEMDENGNFLNFFTTYHVISTSLDEAVNAIKDFEPLHLNKDKFEVEEFEILEESTNDPSGIYQTDGFSIYLPEETSA